MLKLNKKQLDVPEKVFSAEVYGNLYQNNNKFTNYLESIEFIQKISKVIGSDRFGQIVVTGYVTTIQGNHYYCTSDRCNDEIVDQ